MPPDDKKDRSLEFLEEIARLTEEISYFKTLLDQLPVGVYRTSKDGRFLQANPALAKILGYSQDELKDLSAPDFFTDPQDRARQLISWKEKGGITSDELRLTTKDGRAIWVRDTGKAILDEDGEVSYFDGVIEDITDRKEAQDALKESEEQLRHAQKMEALGRLASGVAHDINNVLGAVMGSTSALHFEMDNDHPMIDDLDNILKACKKGRDLTRDLLGFSRKGKYARSVFSPNQVIKELRDLLARTIPKKISVNLDLDPDLAHIEGDWTQIEQALMNVCLNALDAMGKEGCLEILSSNTEIEVTDMRASQPLSPGKYVEIVVSDTGPGIDNYTLLQVFEPFFTTKPKGKGTGLGLSTVYGTIKNHNGYVQIFSTPGTGTQVRFLLPCVPTKDGIKEETQEATRPVFHLAGNNKVLLVDDETTILKAHGRMLEQLGFEVIQTLDGLEAIELFSAHREEIAVVFLDLIMPGLDGGEIFNTLKEIDSDAKVIICSGYIKDDKIERLLAGGARGFLQKPFEMQALAETLAQALS